MKNIISSLHYDTILLQTTHTDGNTPKYHTYIIKPRSKAYICITIKVHSRYVRYAYRYAFMYVRWTFFGLSRFRDITS